jgi:spermidine synthase
MEPAAIHPTPSSASGSLRKAARELVAASFVVLLLELALIRWMPGQVRVLAYFPNLILISAFLGLGIGCLRAGKGSLLWLWPFSLVVLVGSLFAMSRVVFTQESMTEHLWLLYLDLPRDAPVIGGVRIPIIVGFVLSAATFIPLGQIVAERLNIFADRSISLWGYAWDILGSLLGVIGFTVLSFVYSFPIVWFSVILGVGLIFYLGRKRQLLVYILAALLVLGLVGLAERARAYSPYYAVSTSVKPEESQEAGFILMTNGSFHQHTIALNSRVKTEKSWHLKALAGYHHPYRQLQRPLGRVLVLGAGTGNDVSVLLDEGAEEIDAVEIDPVILDIGQNHHPDRPYSSPRVRVINTDARSYMNTCRKKYDLIVFGTLDSQTRLSALSNVRLDNFVYTRESMLAARNLLTPDGGMVLYFMVATGYIDLHLFGLLASVFDGLPVIQKGNFYLFNRIFMVGPAFTHLQTATPEQAQELLDAVVARVEIPTDDWPYLYLSSRGVSGFYLSLLLILAGLAVAGVFLFSREMRTTGLRRQGTDLEMFLFGVAFLLMETKFVTSMNLVWGATWLTSSVVFGSILAMILLATVITKLKPMNWWIAFGGLIITLLAVYFIPIRHMLVQQPALKLILSVLFVGCPVFFASVCFALRFRERKAANLAFGWNLLGAVVGGLLEFFSMLVGLSALTLFAVAAYLGVLFMRERCRHNQ